MDEWELRETIIDKYDIYDLVELLGLTTEDLVDTFGILEFPTFRTRIINDIEG